MGWTPFAIAFDLHGNAQHAPTVKAFHAHCRNAKPKIRVLGGDVWDFPRLRRGAEGGDLKKPLLPDFEAGCSFIETFRPNDVLLGNHDHRLWRAATDDTHRDHELSAKLVAEFKVTQKRLGFRLHPYSKTRVVKVGPLNVLHGFYSGINAARQHALVYGPCLFGHVHTGEHSVVPRFGARQEAWSAPWMGARPDYAEQTPSTMKWVNGWMAGAVNGRKYHVETVVFENGSAVVSAGYKVLAA